MSAQSSDDFSTRLAVYWAAAYTIGLSHDTRRRRIGQIRSDVWEHQTDRSAEGASRPLITLELLSRVIRGAFSDVMWRMQLEEPQMQVNIPIQRLGGILFLLLVAAAPFSLSVAGYDTSRQGFEGELERLAGIAGYQVAVYSMVQVICGFVMLAGAVILCLALRPYASTTSLVAAVALASTGVMVFICSALYSAAAEMADDYVASSADTSAALLSLTRSLLLILTALNQVATATLALAVFSFASIATRHELVPRWLTWVLRVSVASLAISVVLTAIGTEVAWLFVMSGLTLLLVWLLVAGWSLVFREGSAFSPEPLAELV